MKKVHYKMFKAGKKWMVAGIATFAMSTGAFFLTSNNANADVVANASNYTGTPYSYGGNGSNGIDCSALVQNAYAADGITLPRTSGEQYSATTQISAADAQPGDLVFFGNQGSDHVGIYSGNGNMINAETIDGVTSRQISVMERYLGTATYGRVNGGGQASAVTPSNQNNTSVVNPDYSNDTMILAATPQSSDTNEGTASSQSKPENSTPDATKTESSNTSKLEAGTTNGEANTNQNNPAVAGTTNLTNNAQPTSQTTTQNSDGQASVKNDNLVSLNKSVKTADNAVATANTNVNSKATLPATGQRNNSLLSMIGLALVSFVAMFGIKLRKDNNI